MPTRRRAGGRRIWAARALAASLSLLAALVVLEAGLRLLWVKRWTVDAGLAHPTFYHRMPPGSATRYATPEFDVTIRTNRLGLRGPEPARPKPAGTLRLLMLGDSYTFGFPVRDEETFCHLIEQGLRAEGYAVEVVNGGISGYSPTLEYLSLREEFLQFDPDLVILWYDLGDLQDDYRYQKNLRYDAQGRLLGADPGYVNGRFDGWEWAANRSALAKYVRTKIVRTVEKVQALGLRGYLHAKRRGERAKVAIGRLRAQQGREEVLEHERFLWAREYATEAQLEQLWPVSGRYLALIHDLLAARGVPFVLGLYPYGMIVGPDQWAKGRVPWGFESGRTYDGRLVQTVVGRWAESRGLLLLDAFDAFRRAGASEKLFYDWDGHFTPAGHRVLAAHVVADPRFRALLRRRAARRGAGRDG
jgi:DNA-binding response OmpR family regulator